MVRQAQNIVEIARELNLGRGSIVFIDDNPAERPCAPRSRR
jgi:predicted enzyme involved in methoxymalonyl-ACP biosynthesis